MLGEGLRACLTGIALLSSPAAGEYADIRRYDRYEDDYFDFDFGDSLVLPVLVTIVAVVTGLWCLGVLGRSKESGVTIVTNVNAVGEQARNKVVKDVGVQVDIPVTEAAELRKFTVETLRTELRLLGYSGNLVSGTKEEIIERLRRARLEVFRRSEFERVDRSGSHSVSSQEPRHEAAVGVE